MKVIFTQNKDGHLKQQVLDISPNEFAYWYWRKKGCIQPLEQTKADKPKTTKKKRQSKKNESI